MGKQDAGHSLANGKFAGCGTSAHSESGRLLQLFNLGAGSVKAKNVIASRCVVTFAAAKVEPKRKVAEFRVST